jgi:hypothetical protein
MLPWVPDRLLLSINNASIFMQKKKPRAGKHILAQVLSGSSWQETLLSFYVRGLPMVYVLYGGIVLHSMGRVNT